MNCLSGQAFQNQSSVFQGAAQWIRVLLIHLTFATFTTNAAETSQTYTIRYTLTPEPEQHTVAVELDLRQVTHLFREMRFDRAEVADLSGDGDLVEDGDQITWKPPAKGGKLTWTSNLNNKRNAGGYDAWLDTGWGLFRAEDVVPRAATKTLKGAVGDIRVEFSLPSGWSVITEYAEENKRYPVPRTDRRFTQPSGWIVMGKLGTRREKIAGTRVAVAAPVGENVRRMDMLALLNWTLPELVRILPKPVERLTIVSAGSPMWRGALSAPQSLYMHADRPMISENGTSTLLHEVMHVAMGTSARRGYDWIVEGFAEYYSLQLLSRSGTVTLPRYREALKELREWSKSADTLCSRHSRGPQTAMAVTVLHDLDEEIKAATRGKNNLDDILEKLVTSDAKLDLQQLRREANALIGKNPDALHSKRLPGCSKLEGSNASS
jgi:hypothetical protein